jgi:hypothetical protein
MDLLTTYTHRSELQIITAPPLISTLQIITTHAKSSPAYYVFTSRSLIMASNSGDSSAPAPPLCSLAHISQLTRLPQMSSL